MTHIHRQTLRDFAREAGIEVTGVTTADPFEGVSEALEERIERGHMNGLDWFTIDRARFSSNPRNLHQTAHSIISIGVPYRQPDIAPPDDDEPRGNISRYAWGRDYHKTLKTRMKTLHAALERHTGRTVEARLLVDTARIVDRAVAARSGLGWYGKNTMILSPGHGSWVMLGDMIVDIEIEPDAPLRTRCGQCTRCLDNCPTGALVGNYTVDTPRCISFLTIELRGPIPHELRPQMGNWVFGCDVCQEVCPYTKAARPADESDFAPARIENAYPSLRWLLQMSEDEFRDIYRGTAVLRTKRSGLARNAAIALGNIGNDRHLDTLERTVQAHDEPLARGHAAWAMARINYGASASFLVGRLMQESDPYVRDEISTALSAEPAVTT